VWLRPEHVVAGCLEAGLLALLGATSLLVSVQSTEAAQVRLSALLLSQLAGAAREVLSCCALCPSPLCAKAVSKRCFEKFVGF
jgi:hypothetical protein